MLSTVVFAAAALVSSVLADVTPSFEDAMEIPQDKRQSVYVVTCHNDVECGTVCGRYQNDIVAFTEGIFQTSCTCQPGASPSTYLCTQQGVQVKVCSDYQPPRCSAPCGEKVCMFLGNRKSSATVLSACPRHHPQNTRDCCANGGSWCTCIVQATADLNWKPYGELGNANGWGWAEWGSCNSELGKLHIRVDTERASDLVEPFVSENCEGSYGSNSTIPAQTVDEDYEACYAMSEAECGKSSKCTWCNASEKVLVETPLSAGKCYEAHEAEVITHIMNTEVGQHEFVCSL